MESPFISVIVNVFNYILIYNYINYYMLSVFINLESNAAESKYY